MARYSASGRAAANAASGNILSLRSSSAVRVELAELHVFTEAATLSPLALAMTTVTDTAGTAVAGQKEDSGSGAPSGVLSLAPTGGTKSVPIRGANLPAVVGSAMIWTWQPGQLLKIPVLSSVILYNPTATAGSTLTWTVIWEE